MLFKYLLVYICGVQKQKNVKLVSGNRRIKELFLSIIPKGLNTTFTGVQVELGHIPSKSAITG